MALIWLYAGQRLCMIGLLTLKSTCPQQPLVQLKTRVVMEAWWGACLRRLLSLLLGQLLEVLLEFFVVQNALEGL